MCSSGMSTRWRRWSVRDGTTLAVLGSRQPGFGNPTGAVHRVRCGRGESAAFYDKTASRKRALYTASGKVDVICVYSHRKS